MHGAILVTAGVCLGSCAMVCAWKKLEELSQLRHQLHYEQQIGYHLRRQITARHRHQRNINDDWF